MKKLLIMWLMLVSAYGFAQTAEDFYDQGKSDFDDKNYTDAVRLFDKSLDENPDFLPALFHRGISNYHLNNFDNAIGDFSRVIDLDPTMAEAYYYRAMSKEAKGQKDGAYIDYESATILDDKNTDYFLRKAQLAQKQEDKVGAVVAFSKAANIAPDNQVAVNGRRDVFKTLSKDELADLGEIAPELTAAAGKEFKKYADDPKTIEMRKYIQEHKFTDMADAKRYYHQIQYGKGFNPGKKTVLIKELRVKALKDLYGEAPYKEEIEAMKMTINQNSWLRPDGMNYYFNLIKNSPNWFTDGVQRKHIYYYYNVTRSKGKSYYNVKMYAVVNKTSNVVFATKVRVYEDSVKRTIKVFDSQNRGYRWKTSSTEYLSAETITAISTPTEIKEAIEEKITGINKAIQTVKDSLVKSKTEVEIKVPETDIKSENIGKTTFDITSGMGAKKDTNHGVSSSNYQKFITPKDASESAVIKSALNRLILDYPKVFLSK